MSRWTNQKISTHYTKQQRKSKGHIVSEYDSYKKVLKEWCNHQPSTLLGQAYVVKGDANRADQFVDWFVNILEQVDNWEDER